MRRLLLALPVLPVLLLAACGDDDTAPVETSPPTTAAPVSTAPPTAAGGPTYATAPDDVVIEVNNVGGFAPIEAQFAMTPTALVTGDGRYLTTGPTTMQFPGALLPNLRQQTITPAGIEQLLAEADQLGLLAEVEYSRPNNIADAPDTVVTITVGGETYAHAAYALGLEPETDPARVALADFVATMTDPGGTIGTELGPDEEYEPAAYVISAEAVDLATMTFEVEPTVQPWPADAPVRLADVGDCSEIPAEPLQALFADANQLTFFDDGGVSYQVLAVQQYPGRAC